MKSTTSVAWFLLVLAVPFARAEDKKPLQPEKQLHYFVGKWDATVKFKLPDGKEGSGRTACETKSILDGKFVHQEYKSKFMGMDLTIVQILGYDDAKKKFVEFDVHIEGKESFTIYTEGKISENGKILTLSGDSLDMMTGKPTKLKTVTTIVDDDHYTLEWFFPGADGKDERKVMLSHTRKK